MTRHLENALGLPHLDDIMKEGGVTPTSPLDDIEAAQIDTAQQQQDAQQVIANMERANASMALVEGTDHAKKMDTIYTETLDHAQKVMDLAYNIDPRGAPRYIEVATGLYKTALDAANSKRDAQLKAMQLMINQQKLDLEKRAMGEAAPGVMAGPATVMVEDRNDIIKRLREQAKKD